MGDSCTPCFDKLSTNGKGMTFSLMRCLHDFWSACVGLPGLGNRRAAHHALWPGWRVTGDRVEHHRGARRRSSRIAWASTN
jgi:hypothetical protein